VPSFSIPVRGICVVGLVSFLVIDACLKSINQTHKSSTSDTLQTLLFACMLTKSQIFHAYLVSFASRLFFFNNLATVFKFLKVSCKSLSQLQSRVLKSNCCCKSISFYFQVFVQVFQLQSRVYDLSLSSIYQVIEPC
jgi:hypothetical protein